jgi:ABC-2 type transport system permease protein
VIYAILRAQWLSMRLGGSRGAVFSVITGVIWYGMWAALSWFGYRLARGATDTMLAAYLPLAFLAVCAYWQLTPILTASMGSSLDMRKLIIYPLPHEKLFGVEILLRVATGAEMLLLIAASATGLGRNPHTSSWRIVLPVVLFVLFNLLLASGARSLLERLLARRRVREVLVFLLFALWMSVRLFFLTGNRQSALHGWPAAIESAIFPWTAAAWASLGRSTAAAIGSLACWTLAAGWFGRTQFERSLRYDSIAAQATPAGNGRSRARSIAEAFYRLPSILLRDPLAAIVEKELRSLSRTPRYRMVFVMGFSFGLMIWLPMILGGRAERHQTISQHFLTLVCVYALTLLGQVSFWNCFGFDRSAAQIYYAAPPPMRTTLIGKNIASLIFIYLEAAVLTAVVALFRITFRPSQLAETFLVLGVCALYMLAMGNISSVQYPRGLNPERVSQGGASSRFQALIFLLYPLCLVPVFLAFVARYAFSSEIAFYVVLAFAALVGGIVYWIAMDSAVGAAIRRREQIIFELSGADGPIASD